MKALHVFFGVLFGVIGLIGLYMLAEIDRQQRVEYVERRYIETRGKAPMPAGWKGSVGEGI